MRFRRVGPEPGPGSGRSLFGGLFGGSPSLRSWRGVIIRLTQAAFVLLVISGFAPILLSGDHLSGFPLLFHLKIAPLFVILLALLALASAHDHRFKHEDWQGFQAWRDGADEARSKILRKLLYWLILATTIVLILSVALSMFPLFSSAGLDVLLKIHGFSALFLIVLVMIYSVLRT